MRRPKDTFRVPREFGVRLRELRLKACRTQQELAVQMGRQGRGGHFVVGRLERGDVPYPSLAIIADYLRACGAGFRDVLDILDAYTSKPNVIEQQGDRTVRASLDKLPYKLRSRVLKYDQKMVDERRKAGLMPEPAEERLKKSRRLARAEVARREMEKRLTDTINNCGVPPTGQVWRLLREQARRVWGALHRTRYESPERRRQLLARVHEKLLATNLLPEKTLTLVEQAAAQLFDEAERRGRLDRLPGTSLGRAKSEIRMQESEGRTAEGGGKTEVKGQKAEAKRQYGEQAKAEVRTRKRSRRSEEAEARRAAQEEFSRRMTAHQLARDALIERLEEEVKPLLADAGVSTQRYVGYLVTVRAVANVVDRLKPGTEQFQRETEAVIASRGGVERGYDPALLRRVADHAAKRYSELRHTLPPNPRG